MVDIARKNLFHDRTRFAITVIGVTFSVVLIFSQFGIYLGFMENASIIIDNTKADIWITSKNSANFDFPVPFSELKLNKVKATAGVAAAEKLILGWARCASATEALENVELIGFNPETGVGGPWRIKEGSLADLKTGKGVIVDESAFPKLGRLSVGDHVEINEHRVRVVGISEGVRGLTTAPYVFTTYRAAQDIDPVSRDRTVFIVARVAPGYDHGEVVSRLQEIRDVDVCTRDLQPEDSPVLDLGDRHRSRLRAHRDHGHRRRRRHREPDDLQRDHRAPARVRDPQGHRRHQPGHLRDHPEAGGDQRGARLRRRGCSSPCSWSARPA